MRRWFWTLTAALAFAAAAPAAAQPGEEPSPEAVEEARAAYQRGAELFAAEDFEGAVVEFKASYRLTRNPLLLYNIGYTLDELGDKKLALFYYRKFLSDSPGNVKNRDVAAARARELEAELEGRAPPPPEETGDPAGAAATPEDFEHIAVGETPPGQPLDITASAPKDVGWSVYLFYRGSGDAEFTQIPMRWRYRELVARVPAAKVAGSSLQYYVEVRDAGDEVVTRSGLAASPHVVLIDETAKPRYYPDFEDDSPTEPAPSPQADRPARSTMEYAKWGSTGASLGFLALSATFLFVASDASSALEGEAVSSRDESCSGGPPCRAYDSGLESRGKRFETLGNVTLVLAVAAGATAGVLWYLDGKKSESEPSRVSATPAVGKDFVGGAATVRF